MLSLFLKLEKGIVFVNERFVGEKTKNKPKKMI